MQRFYFDLQHEADACGVELRDAAAAGRYALRYASELIRDMDMDAFRQNYWRMDVHQEDGAALFSLVLELAPVRAGTIDPLRRTGMQTVTRLDGWRRRRA